MKRVSIFLLILTAILLGKNSAFAATTTTSNSLGIVVDAFTTSATSYPVGAKVTVTAKVRAGKSVVIPQTVAAVRNSQGANFDFPGQWNVSVGTTAKTLTFTGSLTAAGSYTVQFAYFDGTAWTGLLPTRTFTVTAAATTSWRSGAYTGWPQTISTLDAFGTFRNRTNGMAADYLDHTSWATIEGPSWFMDKYRSTAYTTKLLIGVPMLPDDPTTTLARGATGAYNFHFQKLAQNLVAAGLSNSVIRPGWEFNSPVNYRWSGVAQPAEFAAYFRNIVATMRAVSPNFKFDLCFTVAVDGTRLDLSKAWPGDAYVDIIGLDLYDMTPGGGGYTPAQRWNWYLTAPGGLNYMKAFANAHGKKMSFDEWALASPSWGGGGDSPYFIQAMYDWMTANQIAHETYNNVRYTYTNGKLDDGSYPLASAKYRALFGG